LPELASAFSFDRALVCFRIADLFVSVQAAKQDTPREKTMQMNLSAFRFVATCTADEVIATQRRRHEKLKLVS